MTSSLTVSPQSTDVIIPVTSNPSISVSTQTEKVTYCGRTWCSRISAKDRFFTCFYSGFVMTAGGLITMCSSKDNRVIDVGVGFLTSGGLLVVGSLLGSMVLKCCKYL